MLGITQRCMGIWAVMLALLACAPQAPAPAKTVSYRNSAAPIYSTAGLPIARLIGTWRQVASAAPPAGQPCTPAPFLQITAMAGNDLANGGQPMAIHDLCLAQGRHRGAGVLRSAGAAGRYQLDGLDAPLWVLWISSDATAMAIGTPSGNFAMILSKTQISPDKMRAAYQVLAWNGYDLAQIYQF